MRSLRVVIADGGTTNRADLLSLVERAGFELVGEAVEPAGVISIAASKAADLVVISGDPAYAHDVVGADGTHPTVVVAPDAASSKEYAESGAFAVVTPTTDPDLITSMGRMALARATELRSVRKEADELRNQLETRKVVERAKGVLMRRLGLSEEASYKRMQKASQDENRKLREIAESILSAERLYGGDDATAAATEQS